MGANDLALTADADRHAVNRGPIVNGEYLTCRVGAKEYGIDIAKVQEIRGYDTVTRIADTPAHILGVFDLRGALVPIVDLRVKFALAEARYDAFTVVIVLNVGERIMGAVVDSVTDVLALAPEQIQPAPMIDALPDARCIAGVASVRRGDAVRTLFLLDSERLMQSAEAGRAAPQRR